MTVLALSAGQAAAEQVSCSSAGVSCPKPELDANGKPQLGCSWRDSAGLHNGNQSHDGAGNMVCIAAMTTGPAENQFLSSSGALSQPLDEPLDEAGSPVEMEAGDSM